MDCLVQGCGASAMAFVDVVRKQTDACFTLVDRRAAPGGQFRREPGLPWRQNPGLRTRVFRMRLISAPLWRGILVFDLDEAPSPFIA